MNSEDIIIISFIFFLLAVVFLLLYVRGRNDWRSRFIYRKKLKSINYLKLLKWWSFLQAFTLLTYWGEISKNWVIVFLIPASVIFWIVGVYFSHSIEHEGKWLNTKEADDYQKADNRDKKINQIL